MNYRCIKSILVGEQDTSPIRTEVFTNGVEYTCVDGFLTDNIGAKRSIDKPKFKEHFKPVGSIVELPGKIIDNESFNAGAESAKANSKTLMEVIENLSGTLGRYEAAFKRIEQLANVPVHMGTAEMYAATRSIISICDGLKRMPANK